MKTFLYCEMNVFALLILAVILFNTSQRKERQLHDQKLFIALLYANALILVLDSLMWALDGVPGAGVRGLLLVFTVIYYILNPVICLLWAFYADYHIFGSVRVLRKRIIPALIPVLANAVLSLASFSEGLMFYFDGSNVYHRGPLFFVMAAINYFYLVYPYAAIVFVKKAKARADYRKLLAFALPPVIGGVIQSLFYGVSLVWTCMTVSILLAFINFQNVQLHTDYLTGLFNRRQLDSYIRQRLQNGQGGSLLAGIMLDLDSFKTINDIYGHDVGDQALKHTAAILRSTFRKHDFIARYGGDEFVVLMEIANRQDLDRAMERLNETVKSFNARKAVPYDICLSIGYDCYVIGSEVPFGDFLKHIDNLMYEDKKQRGLYATACWG